MRAFLFLVKLTVVSVFLGGCQTLGYQTGFSNCDNQAAACYQSCQGFASEGAYASCQANCTNSVDRCFDAAYDRYRYAGATTLIVNDPWIGRYGAWYPNRGYVFGFNRFAYPRPFVGPRRGLKRRRYVHRAPARRINRRVDRRRAYRRGRIDQRRIERRRDLRRYDRRDRRLRRNRPGRYYGPPPRRGRGGPPPRRGRAGPPSRGVRGGPPPRRGRAGPPPRRGSAAPPPRRNRGAGPPQRSRTAPPRRTQPRGGGGGGSGGGSTGSEQHK